MTRKGEHVFRNSFCNELIVQFRGFASGVHIRFFLGLAGFVAMLSTASAQSSFEQIERELSSAWLVTIAGDSRARTFNVVELARRSDGSLMLDATYGWVIGAQSPVRADLVQADSRLVLTIRTQSNDVIVVRQDGPGRFNGTFTSSSGKSAEVTVVKANAEALQRRLEEELAAARSGPGFAQENRDWGLATARTMRSDRMHAPTPKETLGARTLTTIELFFALNRPNPPLLIDVLDGQHATIRGAHWMPGAGEIGRAADVKLEAALSKLCGGDKAKPLAFFCLSSECWLSINAAVRALELGYKNVYWYRGGVTAWRAANLDTEITSALAW